MQGSGREVEMYRTRNREAAPREKKAAGMNDVEILERAIALVGDNAPEHRALIGRLAMAAQAMAGIEPICGPDEPFTAYKDRPEAVARTVLDDFRFRR